MSLHPSELPHLTRLGKDKSVEGAITCLALAHNEANIIGPFLEHYRALGPVSFVIVDDHSTDGTREFLEAQDDVTIYQPKPGSSYARDKRAWRSEILDSCADGKWCLVPDIDEHLVYRGMERTPLPEFIAGLEEEGAEALFCIMVDMYADRPLAKHVFEGGSLKELRQAFPLFDRLEGWNYRFVMGPSRYRKKFPTPPRMVTGGMMERLFAKPDAQPGLFGKYLLLRYGDLSTGHELSKASLAMNYLARRILRRSMPQPVLDLGKLALIRWQGGMQFNGGAHAVDRGLHLSEQRGALLHYRFTRGLDGIRYIARRGQHAKAGAYYSGLLSEKVLHRSPVGAPTTAFRGEASLGALLR